MTTENMPQPSADELKQRSAELDQSNLLGEASERAQEMMQLRDMSAQMDAAMGAQSTAHYQEMDDKYRPVVLDEEQNPFRNRASGSLAHKRAEKKHHRQMAQYQEARDNVDTEHKDMAIEEAERIHPTAFKQHPATSDQDQVAA